MLTAQRGDRGDRLNDAGFVVRQLHRHQRWPLRRRKQRLKRGKIDAPVAADWRNTLGIQRASCMFEHCVVLDSGNDQSSRAGVRQRQMQRLRGARREHDVLGARIQCGGDALARARAAANDSVTHGERAAELVAALPEAEDEWDPFEAE